MLGDGSHVIEDRRGPTAWLHRQRFRIVLWVAGAEGIVAWATHGLHIATIVVLAALAALSLALYRVAHDRTHSPLLHQLVWLLAASQLGAVVLVTAGYVIIGALIVLLAIFALAALGLLLLEHR